MRKKTLVQRVLIDPETFAITLVDDQGRQVAKERLSEGEKQIFAISVLWGLSQASARPLPAIIDTPMARLSSQAKEQLIRLKTRTDIGQWNILCRWAFCLSLAEPTPPTPIEIPADSNVEMSWAVFGGDCHELYLALLVERCVHDGLEMSAETAAETLSRQFRLHLHRGIGYLATPNRIRSIGDLVALATTERPE